MANPRQRRKSRSSSHKPVHHSGRAKRLLKKQPPIRGPKVLQDAWDKHKTVRQNYAALGLVHSLNPTQAGGVEISLGASTASTSIASAPAPSTRDPLPSNARMGTRKDKGKEKEASGAIPKGYGRIVRDADGNIVDVELGDEEQEGQGKQGDVDMLVEEKAWKEASKVDGAGRWVSIGQEGLSNGVVKALEALSSSPALPRHSSPAELAYLQRLVRKHGGDLEAMSRDIKLNTEQKTAGELGRAIKKAGGVGRLSEDKL